MTALGQRSCWQPGGAGAVSLTRMDETATAGSVAALVLSGWPSRLTWSRPLDSLTGTATAVKSAGAWRWAATNWRDSDG